MIIFTVAQGYPEWVVQNFCNQTDVPIMVWDRLQEPICSTRMYTWYDEVKKLPKDEIVILSDCRDVLIQGDLKELRPDKLWVFCESEDYTIQDEPYNRDWILQGWGEEGLRKIGHKPISCAGVTIGRQEDVARYLRLQCEGLEYLPFRGADQGLHNWMIWNNQLDYKIWDNNGPVYTVGLEPSLKVHQHRVYNRINDIPLIVHQYDRHITLV